VTEDFRHLVRSRGGIQEVHLLGEDADITLWIKRPGQGWLSKRITVRGGYVVDEAGWEPLKRARSRGPQEGSRGEGK